MDPPPGPTPLARLARLGTMGYELVAAIVVLGALGWGADWLLGTGPVGLIAGGVIGVAGGLYRFLRDARRALREGAER